MTSNRSVSDKALSKLLVDVQLFDNMTAPKKAAFRARVSRYLAIVSDENHPQHDEAYTNILTAVQSKVGKAAKKSNQGLTIEELEQEFDSGLPYDETRKIAAFRAKAKRLFNKVNAMGDRDTADRARAIIAAVTQDVKEVSRRRIIALAMKAGFSTVTQDHEDTQDSDQE